jgi:hypothetical protein
MPPAASSFLHRTSPEQAAQFQWIVETVVERTNELRGNSCLISAHSLFDQRPSRYTKSPRLLTVFLARNLLHWPYSTFNAIYSPSSYPHCTNLTSQARKWVRNGCIDALSGLSMAPIKNHAFNAFASAFSSLPQNSAVSTPDNAAAHVIAAVAEHFNLTKTVLFLKGSRPAPAEHPPQKGKILVRPRRKAGDTPRPAAKPPCLDANDQPPCARPPPPDPPAKPVRVLAVPPLPAVRAAAPISPREDLAKAPFLRLLHPVLDQAATDTGLSVREFIADMIAEAIRQKAAIKPLAPEPFLQVLSYASLDVPERLVPHAMFIQQTLCEFAEDLLARDNLQASAAIIRPVRPMAAAHGD